MLVQITTKASEVITKRLGLPTALRGISKPVEELPFAGRRIFQLSVLDVDCRGWIFFFNIFTPIVLFNFEPFSLQGEPGPGYTFVREINCTKVLYQFRC